MIRRTALFCFALAALALTSAPAWAQQAARVDLVLRGVPAPDALAMLTEAARMDLVYSSALVESRRVWCGGEDVVPEEVLGCIARAIGLDYVRRSSGTYVLVAQVERVAEVGTLAGRVVDAETGEPLPYAHVLLSEAGAGTATDAAGAFVVAGVLPGRHTLTASYVGYAPASARVSLAPGERATSEVALERLYVEAAPIVVDGLAARPVSASLGAGEWAPVAEAAFGAAPSVDAMHGAHAVLGVAAADFRDGLTIQGGREGEHVLRLDGATVYEPVALGAALGAMSPLALGRVSVRKAGFGARHGSFLSGVLDAEHIVSPPGATLSVDPLALSAAASARTGSGEITAATTVTVRRSLWDWNRPRALDLALRDWNAVDPVLATTLAGAPPARGYDAHRHGSDVRFTDLHAATRVRFGGLRTLRVSAYRGQSEIATELFAAAEGASSPGGLILSRDRYRWTNAAVSARYSWVQGPRLLLGLTATASRHTLTHAFEQADGALLGLTGNETVQVAERALSEALHAHDAGDDGNRLGEVRIGASADVSIGPGHTAFVALEAASLASRFHLATSGPTAVGLRRLNAQARQWQLALTLEDEVAIGASWTAEPGLRLTMLSGTVYAEPRAALRYDHAAAQRGAFSARVAAGLYRQFVVRYDLATVGPSALVPEMAVWVPASEAAPPRAAHLAAEVLWAPAPAWTLRAEGYLKTQPRLLTLDYDALLAKSAALLRTQSDWTVAGRGRAAGAAVRVERRGPRVSLSAGYARSLAEHRFPGRYGGAWTPAAWEEPHVVSLGASLQALGAAGRDGLALHARGRGSWGRTWAFRRAYYEVLSAHDGATAFAPFDLTRPGADSLPAWLDVSLGATLRRTVRGARVEVGADVANLLDRANALDWWLRQSEAGYEAVTRSAPGLQPSLSVRVGL